MTNPVADAPLAPEITVEDAPAPRLSETSYHSARDKIIADFERAYLHDLLDRAGSNMSEAARIAAVDRTTLYRLMERHAIRPVRVLKTEVVEVTR